MSEPKTQRRGVPTRAGHPGNIVDWITRKRDGSELGDAELRALLTQFMSGQVTDYQMTAWLMAVYFRGLSLDETVSLTDAMLRSGRILEHRGSPLVKVDKHSTGGVGDKISLCLAPLVAACGAAVPMISGRGLGHTGGTLDKLEAIPGYQTQLSRQKFESIVRRVGVSIIGQTRELAPADARIYALRDVTGTVPSMPLIAASILSKKLAAGLDALVMDVKVGRGAFMKDRKSARALSALLVQVGSRLGLPVRGLLTEMSTPIGRCIGNALETREAIEVLKGAGPADTRELTLALGVEMLLAAKVEREALAARERLERALASGAGIERFERMVAAHGGDARAISQPERLLPAARYRHPVLAPRAGFVAAIDALALGELAVVMGAGRTRADQRIDARVGIELLVVIGDAIEKGEPLALLHSGGAARREEWASRALAAFSVSASKRRAGRRVLEAIVPAQ